MKINNAFICCVFLLSLNSIAHAEACNVNENNIKGAWLAANNHAPFEQMEFGVEGAQKVFNSWLHNRPEIANGTWSLKHCNLRISHPTEPKLTYNFTARLNRGKLELKEKDYPVGKFRRFKG